MTLGTIPVANAIAALGALGTASFGLVDASKCFSGGISRVGVANIKDALKPLYGGNPSEDDRSTPLTYASVLDNLRANWMNGTDLADQKAIAKTLIKLRLNAETAPQLAAATGINPGTLTAIATALNSPTGLPTNLNEAFGRFDLALTSLFDQAYQRADQRYRNGAKLAAGAVSIVIAGFAGYFYSLHNHGMYGANPKDFFRNSFAWMSLMAGALATPIAPIAKDLTSAIAAGTNVVQKLQNSR